jgi:sterol desaturase/sphingolipid hydroxylase (fatty acid hydroxylase superfamily)
MIDYILTNEPKIRLMFFLGIFLVMGFLEAILPRRKRMMTRASRWVTNLGIVFISSAGAGLFFKLIFVGTLVQFAAMLQDKGWGMFNFFIENTDILVHHFPLLKNNIDPSNIKLAGEWMIIIKGVVLMDLIIYFQHRVAHSNRYLWDLHKVHHADVDLDVTSGNRFHPVEILFSLVVKIFAITLFGVHPVSIIIFEVVLNGMAQINHANFKLPLFLDKILRLCFVTPDFHRVHHSCVVKETNSNYGFNLSWWDYMFGTYIGQPRKGHDDMDVGLKQYRDIKKLGLWDLFLMPTDRETFEYADAENKQDVQN